MLGSKGITRLAYIQLQKGDSQGAVEYFERAAEKAKDEGDDSAIITSYLNAGACLVSSGQPKQGSTFLLSALKLAKAQKVDTNVSRTTDANGKNTTTSILEISADIFYNLGVAAQRMNNIEDAISHFKISIDLYLKSDCVLHAAEGFTSLASCHRTLQESEKEITSLVNAQKLYQEAGSDYKEAASCLELARTYLREERVDDCKEMLSTAKLLCTRVNSHAQRGMEMGSHFLRWTLQ